MKDKKRRTGAKTRAERYAPQPLTSPIMYAVVGASLVGLAWAAFSDFYDLEPFGHPYWLTGALLLGIGGSALLRVMRGRWHNAALHIEYEKTDPAAVSKRRSSHKAGGRKIVSANPAPVVKPLQRRPKN